MTFDIFNVITLVGGLALFLYGMTILGSGLEKLSGGRMEQILERATNNVFKSVMLGALITSAVQSSSATTVIVVGLVNAGIIKLRQAVGIIMGANIGTTVTAHILRLSDISSDNIILRLMQPTSMAPIAAVVGIVFLLTAKKAKQKDIGQILLGFGILFTGMFKMEESVRVLQDLPQFASLFAKLSNPILGVIVGAAVTCIIQSSSASIGILQALSATGLITFSSAFPIIMGQNIGTCITPILASIGANKNAKRTAAVHFYFNFIGTVLFLAAIYAFQYTVGFSFWSEPLGRGGIANFHTVFNVTVTLLFMPFTRLLEKIACLTVPDKEGDKQEEANVLDERFMVSPGLAINQARNTVIRMARLAHTNFNEVSTLFDKFDLKAAERIRENENAIDKMEDLLAPYLLRLAECELTEPENRQISELLQLESEFERIGDYSINVLECAQSLYENDIHFSMGALEEMHVVCDAVKEIIEMAVNATVTRDLRKTLDIEPLEETIDLMEETLKLRHIDRLKRGLCSVDAAFPFVETLANLERISDHCSNVGVYLIGHEGDKHHLDRHEYIRKIHKGETEHYNEKFSEYEHKYYDKIKVQEQAVK